MIFGEGAPVSTPACCIALELRTDTEAGDLGGWSPALRSAWCVTCLVRDETSTGAGILGGWTPASRSDCFVIFSGTWNSCSQLKRPQVGGDESFKMKLCFSCAFRVGGVMRDLIRPGRDVLQGLLRQPYEGSSPSR